MFQDGVDKDFNIKENKKTDIYKNVLVYNDKIKQYETKFLIESYEVKRKMKAIIFFIDTYKNIIELREYEENKFELIVEDTKAGQFLIDNDLINIHFRLFIMPLEKSFNGYNYQLYLNKFIYMILEIDNNDNIKIFDYGPIVPLTFDYLHALIYEIKIPESRMLLGMNFSMGI